MKFSCTYWTIIACLIVSFGHDQVEAADTLSCGDWIGFKDEKCFKLIDDTFRTFDEAEKACVAIDDKPTLPIIRSQDEQDFLANYVFKTLKKVENVWIGARFSNNKFHWIDNTDLSYTNWVAKGTKNKTDYCVQMQSEDDSVGKWIDEPCEQKKLVVCQKQQSWSIARLQIILLDARKELRDSLDAANKKIVDLEKNQFQLPIGFIYAQLPKEKSPAEIWPSVNWTDVSTTYARVFFRVNGGDAAAFGQVQDDNAPRLETVLTGGEDHIVTSYAGVNVNVTIPRSGWSKGFYTGISGGNHIYLNLKHSSGEIRPRNMAMRIWKRT